MVSLSGALAFFNIVFAGIAAGTLVAILAAVIPMIRSLPLGAGLEAHRAIDGRIDRYNPALVALSAASGLALLLLSRGLTTPSGLATVVGLGGTLAAGATSLGWNLRINRRIWASSDPAMPQEYAALRRTWDRAHLVRTLAAVIALACYVAAALLE